MFKEMCEVERNAMESACNQELVPGVKAKPKGVHGAQKKQAESIEISSDEEAEIRVHNAQGPPKQRYQGGLKFPCPLNGHKHEIAKCLEILSMSPEDRWAKFERKIIFYTCMQPKGVFTGRRCTSMQKVPAELMCSGCEVDAVAKGWAPLSILLCRKREHALLRAPWSELKQKLEEYFGKFGASIVEKNVKMSVNFLHQAHAVIPKTYAAACKKMLNENVPTIDSSTGCRVDHVEGAVLPEVNEQSFYLMQELLIGGLDCLAFFDGGANTHLMEGELVEREGLQVISDKPSIISFVGGSQIKTKFGTYRFNVGPSDSRDFHELICLGMEKVSGKFAEYNLEQICDEYRDNGGQETHLPKKVGGSRVQLLIGIKNTNLTPTLIKIFPSGVGVFRSPFKDKYGSRIIFAGPHPAFTKGNQSLEKEVSLAVFSIREEEELTESTKDEVP